MNFDWSRLGRAVVARRRTLGLSQVALADAAGLSRSAIQGIERGGEFSSPQLSHRSVAQALGWTPASVADVLAGGEPTLAASPSPSPVPAEPESRIEAGVDALLDDLTARVKGALLGGQVVDATAIDLGPGDEGGVVIIWKQGEGQDLTLEQQRKLRRRWAKLQRAAHEILDDDEDVTE